VSRAIHQPRWQLQADAGQLANALAQAMQYHGAHDIAQQGAVRMGLAGGSTPIPAYAQFAQAALPWSKLHLSLIDERAVPLTDAQSNESAIAKALQERLPQLAAWQGLYSDASDVAAMAGAADAALQAFGLPLDIAVIGMGSDGHIASLFVESADYEKAMQLDATRTVLPIRFETPEHKTDRLSFTLAALLQARRVLFCIAGADKREVLEQSLDGRAPHYAVARFLAAYNGPVDIFWSPA
jgi:6-phosphogluconolactonase